MFESENKMLRNRTHNVTVLCVCPPPLPTIQLHPSTFMHINSAETKKARGFITDNVLTLPFGGGALGLAGTGSWAGFAGIGFLGSLKAHKVFSVRL